MSDVIEAIEASGLVAELHYDEDPMSPKEWDQVGILVTWHRDYTFEVDGRKEFGDPEEFLRQAKAGRWVYVKVGMYDHSGISLYADGGSHAFDSAGWDSGTVGVIYTTRERYQKMADTNLNRWRQKADKILRQEIEVWDQYVQNDVYGIVIKTADGEVKDSCWGFYGIEYARQEMAGMLKAAADDEAKAEKMVKDTFAL